MRRTFWWFLLVLPWTAGLAAEQVAPQTAQSPPQAWTWEQVKDRLDLNNPTLLAGKHGRRCCALYDVFVEINQDKVVVWQVKVLISALDSNNVRTRRLQGLD